MASDEVLDAIIVIGMVFLVVAFLSGLLWLLYDTNKTMNDNCTKICNLKGYEFYKTAVANQCKCLDKEGDIIMVQR